MSDRSQPLGGQTTLEFWKVVRGFSSTDVLLMPSLMAVGTVFGYSVGKPIRMPSAAVGSILGLTAGFLFGYQNSSGRMLGTSRGVQTAPANRPI